MTRSRPSRRIDFVISNDGHHVAMFEPVIRELLQQTDVRIRVISLCEFRGIDTPLGMVQHERVRIHRIVPFQFRRPSSGGQSDTASGRTSRQAIRNISWQLLLRRGIRKWLTTSPDVVVLPNDAAFPYDRLTHLLHQSRIPFVLVQEGIRFPLPLSDGDDYGKNGAAAIAAWGRTSADFFLRQGVLQGRIHLTGSPRFDSMPDTDWVSRGAAIKKELQIQGRPLLLLTNPIDDQGFCTTAGKMALVRSFLEGLDPLFVDPDFSVVIKLHGRESLEAYANVKNSLHHSQRVRILQRVELYPLFAIARASVVFASTVGLESMMFGCPVGVLEIPGYGYVHDYVSSGAAEGLSLNQTLLERIEELIKPGDERVRRIKAYVDDNLSSRGVAAKQVTDLLLHQLQPVRENVHTQ